jgi:hypothetical protein
MWSCADSRAVTDALAMTGSCVGRRSVLGIGWILAERLD